MYTKGFWVIFASYRKFGSKWIRGSVDAYKNVNMLGWLRGEKSSGVEGKSWKVFVPTSLKLDSWELNDAGHPPHIPFSSSPFSSSSSSSSSFSSFSRDLGRRPEGPGESRVQRSDILICPDLPLILGKPALTKSDEFSKTSKKN